MNRAEKRRQKKIAAKAKRAARPTKSTTALSAQQAAEIEQALTVAMHHLQAGDLAQAENLYRRILQVDPVQAEALHLLGAIAQQLGKHQVAVDLMGKAVKLKPDYAEAHNNLGIALKALGKDQEGFNCRRRAVAINPANQQFWTGMARSLESLSFTAIDDNLFKDLEQLLQQRAAVRPGMVVRPILSALRLHAGFKAVLHPTPAGPSDAALADQLAMAQLSAMPLFLQLMGLSPIHDLEIEGLLTGLRRALLRAVVKTSPPENCLNFAAALALQCFTNEYVYSETPSEQEQVAKLHLLIEASIEKKQGPPPLQLAILAAYRPLHSFSWAANLADRRNWQSDPMETLIQRQIREPLDELARRPQIPKLTAIDDQVSQLVRQQYEENPYPRWVKTALNDQAKTLDGFLQGEPMFCDLGDYLSPAAPDILIAGCGTGQQSLGIAAQFANAKVLAIDLSLTSLTYAARKTEELGITNITYAQADIMELADLDQRFDLIESAGVLHHLGDPLAGWRVLTGLVRPGGFMRIGLYSEAARQSIVETRALIARKGYGTGADDIRRCRRDILALAEAGDPVMSKVSTGIDFFNLSNCRDLLFHVQEQRFTPLQIATCLEALGLRFLGFEIPNRQIIRAFQASHPGPDATTQLPLWQMFEQQNPDLFDSMYQFWCQKL